METHSQQLFLDELPAFGPSPFLPFAALSLQNVLLCPFYMDLESAMLNPQYNGLTVCRCVYVHPKREAEETGLTCRKLYLAFTYFSRTFMFCIYFTPRILSNIWSLLSHKPLFFKYSFFMATKFRYAGGTRVGYTTIEST